MAADRDAVARDSSALAAALRDPGRELTGTVVSTVDPVFAEIAASRFDLIWIDLEHSALSRRDVQMLVICARAAGAFSLIRLPGAAERGLGAYLDTGADGIVVPRVEDPELLRGLAQELRFPPHGIRGYAPRRALLTRSRGATPRPACIVQVESTAAVELAPALAEIDVCDALVVGTSDLSFDIGAPLRLDHPELARAVGLTRAAAAAAGKGWGIAGGGSPGGLRRLAGGSGGTLVHASDVGIFAAAIEERSRLLAEAEDG